MPMSALDAKRQMVKEMEHKGQTKERFYQHLKDQISVAEKDIKARERKFQIWPQKGGIAPNAYATAVGISMLVLAVMPYKRKRQDRRV
jgi:hypothetical protein